MNPCRLVEATPMAASNRILVWTLATLILTNFIYAAHFEPLLNQSDDNVPPSDSSWKIKLDQLNSRIRILDMFSIDERSREIKSKDESIKQLEMITREKSTGWASLQLEIQSFQEKGSVDAKDQGVKADARTVELDKQVEILKKEIAQQNMRKEALETRVNLADKKIEELNDKLENLQRINDEQKIRIRKTQRALQVAEEELMRVQLEASDFTEKLKQVREAWIPHWLAVLLVHFESFTVTHWNAYGKPALDVALEKTVQAHKWMVLQVEELKMDWPVIKEQWIVLVTDIRSNMHLLTVKAVEYYHSSKDIVKPFLADLHKMGVLYYKEAKKYTKPYINEVSRITKLHVGKAHVILKRYTMEVLRGCRKLLKMTVTYHRQVRATIHEMLTSHRITTPFATNELESFMAAALMALPVIFVLREISLFWEKPKKRVRHSHTSQTRRKSKRVYSDY